MLPGHDSTRIDADIAIVGGGPAGLMAAQAGAEAGLRVDLFEAMPSTGRKFLLAGKGGLNLTHAESWDRFVTRYRDRSEVLRPMLDGFDSRAVRQWAETLGVATFVGSSQRVFPTSMKAAPLLRAWLTRLRAQGVHIHVRHRWRNGSIDSIGHLTTLDFDTGTRTVHVRARAAVLALGGASWPQLGSDGRWVPALESAGIGVAPLQPANCGFDILNGWSETFSSRHAGEAVKTVGLRHAGFDRRGEFVITSTGIEGSLVYAASADLREAIERDGRVELYLDLLPDTDATRVFALLNRPRAGQSLSNHLRRTLGLTGVKAALLRECAPPGCLGDPTRLSAAIKELPLSLAAPRPIAEAISSAGGVSFESLSDELMAKTRPGVFIAGEMLDWEAPTGGYLLTACLATGHHAGRAAVRWVQTHPSIDAPAPLRDH